MTPTAFLAGLCIGFAIGVIGTLLAILIGCPAEDGEIAGQKGEAGRAGGRGQGAGHGGASGSSAIDSNDIRRRRRAAGEAFRCVGEDPRPAGSAEGDDR